MALRSSVAMRGVLASLVASAISSLTGSLHADGTESAVVVPLVAFKAEGRTIQSGLRIELSGGGELRVSRAAFSGGGRVRFVELPEALGGGFLFAEPIAGLGGVKTAFYRSATFSGDLEALFVVALSDVTLVARDKSVIVRSDSELYELDLATPRIEAFDFYPYVVDAKQVEFGDGEELTFKAPLFGTLASRDDGRTYRAGPFRSENRPSEKSLLTGRVPQREPPRSNGSSDLVLDLLRHGTLVGKAKAISPAVAQLESARDAFVLSRRGKRGEMRGCAGLETLASEGRFLCRNEREVSIFDTEGKKVFSLSPARRIESFAKGGVVFEGSCAEAAPGHCAILERSDGSYENIDVGNEVRASSVFVVARRIVTLDKTKGAFRLRVGSDGKWARFPFPKDEELASFLEHGDIAPYLGGLPDGYAFFVTNADEFVGVRLAKSGAVEIGPIKHGLSRAILGRGRAFLWGAAGFAQESSDLGSTYADVMLPYQSGDGDPSVLDDLGSPVEMGCSAVGCRVGRVVSLFGSALRSAEPTLSPTTILPLPSRGLSRLHFECSLSGRAPRITKSSDATFFWGEELPKAPPYFTRIVHESEGDTAFFVSEGPASVSWSREGKSRLWVHDPFSAKLRVTNVTSGLFSSQTDAEAKLGLLDPASATARVTTSADGKASLYRVVERERLTHLLALEGQPLELLGENGEKIGSGALSIAAFGGEVFLLVTSDDEVRLLGKRGSEWTLISRYPYVRQGVKSLELAVDERGKLAIALEAQGRVFVYPVGSDGTLSNPLTIDLGVKNRACGALSTGYLVQTELSLTPSVSHSDGLLSLTRVLFRHRVGPAGTCLDAVAGRARGEARPSGKTPKAHRPIPLVVSDYGDGSVTSYECE